MPAVPAWQAVHGLSACWLCPWPPKVAGHTMHCMPHCAGTRNEAKAVHQLWCRNTVAGTYGCGPSESCWHQCSAHLVADSQLVVQLDGGAVLQKPVVQLGLKLQFCPSLLVWDNCHSLQGLHHSTVVGASSG